MGQLTDVRMILRNVRVYNGTIFTPYSSGSNKRTSITMGPVGFEYWW